MVKQIADLRKENEDLHDLNKKLQSNLDKTSADIIKLEGEIEDLNDKNKMDEKHILYLEEKLSSEIMSKLEETLHKEKKPEKQEALEEVVFADLNRNLDELEVSHIFPLSDFTVDH